MLENSYLCGISNNNKTYLPFIKSVVICLKIRTFVVSATTALHSYLPNRVLWFAWKFVPLWYQQQHPSTSTAWYGGCDLLENSYLCGISNNGLNTKYSYIFVVICLKIRTFVVSATTPCRALKCENGCDLLENSYLCGISNNRGKMIITT